MGGHTCTPTEWTTACQAKNMDCTWGYAPDGAACTTGFTGSRFCNLGASYGSIAALGTQEVVLPTASGILKNCATDWTGTFTNTAGVNDQIFDLTGNLREITKSAANAYVLMGGAFDTAAESGAACNFNFYGVDQNYQMGDTGFRCCFSQDPTQ
jgi:hypothetical protein